MSDPTVLRQGGLPPAPAETTLGSDEHLLDLKARFDRNLGTSCLDLVPVQFQPIFDYALNDDSARRLRPVLAYTMAEALEVELAEVDGLANTVEALHTASLMIDDLPGQDGSERRRSKASVWMKFGAGQTLAAALYMMNSAHLMAAETVSGGDPEGALTRYSLEQACRLCLGQAFDLATFQGETPRQIERPEELDEIAGLKTSPLMELPIVGTAIIAGMAESDATVKSLREYASHYGIAFQVKDDILDSSQGENGIGKTPDLDRINGKTNYVSLLGVEGAQDWLARHSGLAEAALEDLPAAIETTRLKQVITLIGNEALHR